VENVCGDMNSLAFLYRVEQKIASLTNSTLVILK